MEAESVSQAASLGSEGSLFDQLAATPSPLAAAEAGLSWSEPPGPRFPTGAQGEKARREEAAQAVAGGRALRAAGGGAPRAEP